MIEVNLKRVVTFLAKDVVNFFPFCELESFLVINFNCIVLSAGRRVRYLRECFRG